MSKQKNWEEQLESKELGRAFLLALLGTLCAGILFLALHKFFAIFGGILFLLLGVAAYVFYVYFTDAATHCKQHIFSVGGACMLGMAIVQFADTILIYAPQLRDEDTLLIFGRADMSLLEKTMEIYSFDWLNMLIIYLTGVILSFAGAGLSYVVFSVLLKKKEASQGKGKKSRKKR